MKLRHCTLFLCMFSTCGFARTINILDSIGPQHYNTLSNVLETPGSIFLTRRTESASQARLWIEKYDKYTLKLIKSAEIYDNLSKPDSFLHRTHYPIAIAGNSLYVPFTKAATSSATTFNAALFSLRVATFDTNLVATIPEYELTQRSKAAISFPVPRLISGVKNKTILVYSLRDTLSNRSQCNYALLEGGRFVDKGPYPFYVSDPAFSHELTNIHGDNRGRIVTVGSGIFTDSRTPPNVMRGFVISDTNFNLIDTVGWWAAGDFYTNGAIQGGHFNYAMPYSIILPTGSIIGGGSFQATVTGKFIETNAIARYNVRQRFKLDTVAIYGLPVDPADQSHMSGRISSDIAYNSLDNTIYLSEATHQPFYGQCLGSYNFLKITAVDTNLRLKWEKYIQSGAGQCMTQFGTTSCAGRSGVLVSGMNANRASPGDTARTKGFLYHVDSIASTSIDDQSLVIRDRFRIYPNPASEMFIIDDILNQSLSVTLYDVQGRAVLTKQILSSPMHVEIGVLPAGTYLVRMQLKDGNYHTQRVIHQ